jgi:ribosomal protein S18 acetylase RimI-like enzyme
MADILILTGPPAAGKTSVGLALADRYDRVAHLNLDVIRRFITPTGYASPRRPDYLRQRLLSIKNAAALSVNFIQERFGVIIDDVLDESDFLPAYLRDLAPAAAEVHLIQLLPSAEACIERDMERRKAVRPLSTIRTDYEHYVRQAESLPGSRIDSTALTVEATADRVQALTTSGESIVWRPDGGEPGSAQAPSSVEVRPRSQGDDAFTEGLLTARWGSPRVVSRGRVHDATKLPGFVASVNGRVSGLATYRVDGAECELVTLDSLAENRGVGTALIEAVSSAARALHCRRLWLVTTNDNTRALRFYQLRGFRLAALRPDAVSASRRLKPEIAATGLDGIPLRDEIELELALD